MDNATDIPNLHLAHGLKLLRKAVFSPIPQVSPLLSFRRNGVLPGQLGKLLSRLQFFDYLFRTLEAWNQDLRKTVLHGDLKFLYMRFVVGFDFLVGRGRNLLDMASDYLFD